MSKSILLLVVSLLSLTIQPKELLQEAVEQIVEANKASEFFEHVDEWFFDEISFLHERVEITQVSQEFFYGIWFGLFKLEPRRTTTCFTQGY